jgi:hypothetical protein
MKTLGSPVIIILIIIISLFEFTLSFDNSQIISILVDSTMKMREMGVELAKKDKTKISNSEETKNEKLSFEEGATDITGTQPVTPIQPNNNVTIDNHTYWIHPTGNTTDCIPECYLNCQVHFPDSTELKYCILNVCHCDLVEEGTSGEIVSGVPSEQSGQPGLDQPADILPPPRTVLSLLENPNNIESSSTTITTSSVPDYKFDEHKERRNYYILMLLLFLIMIPLMVYYTIQLFKYWDKSDELGYEFPYVVNDYMLIGEFDAK